MCIRDRLDIACSLRAKRRAAKVAAKRPCISYNRYHSVPKSFICCCSGRDSCMLTSRCMLPWLRSALYPALCPCQPLRPVGDMQAVSYALVPDSTVHCPRPPGRNLDLSLSGHAQGPSVGFICIQLSKLSSREIQLFTHHDIVKQYRKGLTAVVDRCVYICLLYTSPSPRD